MIGMVLPLSNFTDFMLAAGFLNCPMLSNSQVAALAVELFPLTFADLLPWLVQVGLHGHQCQIHPPPSTTSLRACTLSLVQNTANPHHAIGIKCLKYLGWKGRFTRTDMLVLCPFVVSNRFQTPHESTSARRETKPDPV